MRTEREDEKVPEADGGDGSTTPGTCFVPLNRTPEEGHMLNFMLCAFYYGFLKTVNVVLHIYYPQLKKH